LKETPSKEFFPARKSRKKDLERLGVQRKIGSTGYIMKGSETG